MVLQDLMMEINFILEVMEIKEVILVEFLKEGLEYSIIVPEVRVLGKLLLKEVILKNIFVGHFEYPRNFQASLIKEKELDQFAKDAIVDKAALFVPFLSVTLLGRKYQ